jgi:poly-beta-hydroxyalkanoate depolymerase
MCGVNQIKLDISCLALRTLYRHRLVHNWNCKFNSLVYIKKKKKKNYDFNKDYKNYATILHLIAQMYLQTYEMCVLGWWC